MANGTSGGSTGDGGGTGGSAPNPDTTGTGTPDPSKTGGKDPDTSKPPQDKTPPELPPDLKTGFTSPPVATYRQPGTEKGPQVSYVPPAGTDKGPPISYVPPAGTDKGPPISYGPPVGDKGPPISYGPPEDKTPQRRKRWCGHGRRPPSHGGPDPFACLSSEYPILFLPVRLETRFTSRNGEYYLRVRIYPDEIAADAHEPELLDAERVAGADYWEADAESEKVGRAQWWSLVKRFGAPRSAWIVEATEPSVVHTAKSRTESWSRAGFAYVMPDAWTIIGIRNKTEVINHPVEKRVSDHLVLTIAPGDDGENTRVPIPGGGPEVAKELMWTVDFQAALDAGMAAEINIKQEDWEEGFDALYAIGVKASIDPEDAADRLGTLLDNHHYTRGLAFVPQGTPTNNTSGSVSAFPPPDPNGSASYRVERGEALNKFDGNAWALAAALGIDKAHFEHVAGAELHERANARAMSRALWPAALGYFMEEMMDPMFSERTISEAKKFFIENVIPRGPLPAFRVGDTPYGVLPVTSLQSFNTSGEKEKFLQELPRVLRTLQTFWLRQLEHVARTGRTKDDAEGDLLKVLGLEASAQTVNVHPEAGEEMMANTMKFMSRGEFGPGQWTSESARVIGELEAALNVPDWEQSPPKILGMTLKGSTAQYSQAMVADQLSESKPLDPNYIATVRTTKPMDLNYQKFPSNSLLYRLLRHSTLREYVRLGTQVAVAAKMPAAAAVVREKEFIGVQAPMVWGVLNQPAPGGGGQVTILDQVAKGTIKEHLEALAHLETLPTAELDRLLTESLDVCSHRMDAWITALATMRLGQLRAKESTGIHLAGFGWIDGLDRDRRKGLRPMKDGRLVRTQQDNQGYIQSPSMAHAAAAAVLRNAHAGAEHVDRKRYALDLSSARIRKAEWLLDALRNGQNLAAVLGYQFERGLHDRDKDKYVDVFREMFPLDTSEARRNLEEGGVQPALTRHVVHGLKLRKAYLNKELVYPVLYDDERERGDGRDGGVEAELQRLDQAIDATTDLLTADAIFQLVNGNLLAGTASLDSLAQGIRSPEPGISRIPCGGLGLTHRVAIILGKPGQRAPGWPEDLTPRASVSPHVDEWLAKQLGDPCRVLCRVDMTAPDKDDKPVDHHVVVSLANLGIRPLDLLAMAKSVEPNPEDAELDRRIAWVACTIEKLEKPPSTITITYTRKDDWNRAAIVSFPEILELARSLAAFIGAARPLKPVDLLPPECASEASDQNWDTSETLDWVDDAFQTVDQARVCLEKAHTRVTDPDAPPIKESDAIVCLSEALEQAALVGVSGAYPPLPGKEVLAKLVTLTASAAAELTERLKKADEHKKEVVVDGDKKLLIVNVDDAQKYIKALLGSDVPVIPRFHPPSPKALDASLRAVPALTSQAAVRTWFLQAARVRPALARWRRMQMIARALGASQSTWEVTHLPYDEDKDLQWAALPFTEKKPPVSGRVSLVLDRACRPGVDSPWAGLLIDEWNELIPSTTQSGGVAFHYDDPGSEAPQALLLAVHPVPGDKWDTDTVIEILEETLTLIQMRAVEPTQLGMLAQVLPGIHLAYNANLRTVSTSFGSVTRYEPAFSGGSSNRE